MGSKSKEQTMRIYHVCSIYKPSNGIYFVLKNLVPEQRKLGNEVTILNVDKKGISNDIIECCNYNSFKDTLKSNPPDVVIFHGVFYKEFISYSFLLRKNKIPYLIELHGALSKQNMQTSYLKKKIVGSLFLNHVIRKANGVIYLNKNELSNSTVASLNSNNLIIPNGCEPNHLIVKPKTKDRLNMIFMGRVFRQHKGLDVMISAVKKVIKDGLDIHLSIFGRGDQKELEWLSDEIIGFENNIEYLGEVYGDEKKQAFLNANVFILTSRYEGFPIAVLEALSYGLPCIVTPATNVGDIIQENRCGLVTNFTQSDIEGTIKRMYDLSTDIYKEMGKRGKAIAKTYSWDKIGNQSIKEYQNCVETCLN